MKVVPFKTASQNLYQSGFSHFLFNDWVGADIEENVKTDEKEFVLLPDENIQFFELRSSSDTVIFVVTPPHFDVLAVEQIEPLNLVL